MGTTNPKTIWQNWLLEKSWIYVRCSWNGEDREGGSPKHTLYTKGQQKRKRISLQQYDIEDQETVFLSFVNSY